MENSQANVMCSSSLLIFYDDEQYGWYAICTLGCLTQVCAQAWVIVTFTALCIN